MALCGLLRASRGPGRPTSTFQGLESPFWASQGLYRGVYPGVWGRCSACPQWGRVTGAAGVSGGGAECLRRNGSVRPFKGVAGAWTPTTTFQGLESPFWASQGLYRGVYPGVWGRCSACPQWGRLPRAASQGGFPGRLPRAAFPRAAFPRAAFPRAAFPRAAFPGPRFQGRVSRAAFPGQLAWWLVSRL